MVKRILSIENLKKSHLSTDLITSFLFENVSAEITESEIIALIGASGQGKSTVLRILALLDKPDSGQIHFRNIPSGEWNPQEWRMKVCYVAQQPIMLPGTVEDNLRTVSFLHRRDFEIELCKRLLSQVGLADLDWAKDASLLSGGEKQRLALVRSLLLHPDIMLLDEVTSSLDVHSKKLVEHLLQDWHRREGAAMIWVTHDMQQARDMSRRIWFMGEGTLLENQETLSFFQDPSSEAARRFLEFPAQARETTCPS